MVNEICFSDVLLESGTEIFETMAFMSVERVSKTNQKIEGDSLFGSIAFKGDVSGRN